MARMRFPGKALKLNTRKRVRFRGPYVGNNTPEELYTRKIRRGLDLFYTLFGETDEDDDELFEGFAVSSFVRNERLHSETIKEIDKKKCDRAENICSLLEKKKIAVRQTRTGVSMAVNEMNKEKVRTSKLLLDRRTKGRGKRNDDEIVENEKVGRIEGDIDKSSGNNMPENVDKIAYGVIHKQNNIRVHKQPTVKAALARKLLARAKKKCPTGGEKGPKRFILPTMSARSSRIIKPNKRLFADITEMCSTSSVLENKIKEVLEAAVESDSEKDCEKSVKKKKRREPQVLPVSEPECSESDRMKMKIAMYTESITSHGKGQVGRPSKRILRTGHEGSSQEEIEEGILESPEKNGAAKESKVKETIEKLLRSAWDDRLKHSGKGGNEEMLSPTSTNSPGLSPSTVSRSILRKARLNLNKSTLQKIRNPASLQRLVPESDEGEVDDRCTICDKDGGNTRKFGVVVCDICCSFISSASDGPKDVYECFDSKGTCQIPGIWKKESEQCHACWLNRILQLCFMPSLLHDRLRKRLPPILRENIPTSLARSMNICASPTSEKDIELNNHTKRLPLDPGGGGGGVFGNVMDLPGGWKRVTGSSGETIVISPSGEKFKSMLQLEAHLTNRGINADARVLFGNSRSSSLGRSDETKLCSVSSSQKMNDQGGRVVMTTLPGGWTRRIKWRLNSQSRFDTYVTSPDGRTFRSKRELSAYFQQIGKVDDIHKYFPVVNGNSDSSTLSSSEALGSSSTEPVSSSEIGTELSSDAKSPVMSEVEIETPDSTYKKNTSRILRRRRSPILSEVELEIPKNENKTEFKISKTSVISEVNSGSPKTENKKNKPLARDKPHSPEKSEFKLESPKNRIRHKSKGNKKPSFGMSIADPETPKTEKGNNTKVLRSRRSPVMSEVELETPQCESKKLESKSRRRKYPVKSHNEVEIAKDKNKQQRSKVSETSDELEMPTRTNYCQSELGKEKSSSKTISESKNIEPGPTTPENEEEEEERQLELQSLLSFVPAASQEGKTVSNQQSMISPKTTPKRTRNDRRKSGKGSLTQTNDSTEILNSLKIDKKYKLKALSPSSAVGTKSKLDTSFTDTTESDSDFKVSNPSFFQKSLLTFGETRNLFMKEPLLDNEPQTLCSAWNTDLLSVSEDFESSEDNLGTKDRIISSDNIERKTKNSGNFIKPCSVPDSEEKNKSNLRTKISIDEIKKNCNSDSSNYRDMTYSPDSLVENSPSTISQEKNGFKISDDDSSDTVSSKVKCFKFGKKSKRVLYATHKRLITKKKPKLKRKLSKYENQSFGNGWSRRLRWNEKGEGRISFLHTPDGHTIHSRIELIAYFKKAGKSKVDVDYYFPPILKRENELPTHTTSGVNDDDGQLTNLSITEHSTFSSELSEFSDKESVVSINEIAGPRVKHVCRSQAQVLGNGLQRAVFPSPEKTNKSFIGGLGKKRRKVGSFVATTASGKVLRKTMWCNKCEGCTTPNCQKCHACKDMKKYGGPGTKKKPCIMRKCLNPRLSQTAANAVQANLVPEKKVTVTKKESLIETKTPERSKSPISVIQEEKPISKEKPSSKKEMEVEVEKLSSVVKVSQPDKSSVFVPRQVTRLQPDQKERSDIVAGKQFVPGALVNIDYWQGYDVDEMLLSGFSVTTSSPLYTFTLCFRCGSAGTEQLLFCIWCCEGIHLFCMEDGEAPESDEEEMFWICRRCAVCHVCGSPGPDSLLRCSDCRNYYHMECLGPSAHSTCQPSPDRPWKCVGCVRCCSCGSPNVTRWLDISDKLPVNIVTPDEEEPYQPLAFCNRCISLREKGNYCPLCNGCYEDDDYDAKMMECGRCGEWVHAHCESLNNEHYQILSYLPDSVEYVCRLCILEMSSNWLDAVNTELMAGCESVIQALLQSRCAKHLVKKEALKLSALSLPVINPTSLEKKIELLDRTSHGSLESDLISPVSFPRYGILNKQIEDTILNDIDNSVINQDNSQQENPLLDDIDSRDVYEKGIESESSSIVVLDNHKEKIEVFDNEKANVLESIEKGEKYPQPLNVYEDSKSKSLENMKYIGNTVHNDESMLNVAECKKNRSTMDQNSKVKNAENTAFVEYKQIKRIPTRSTTMQSPLDNDVNNSISNEIIKLKECSVRLEDICKPRSRSLSPKHFLENENEDKTSAIPSTNSKLEPLKGILQPEGVVESQQLENKKVDTPSLNTINEEKNIKDSSSSCILPSKETDVCCTQVDGPNDETPSPPHMRNLFYENRTSSYKDKLNDSAKLDNSSGLSKESLSKLENQLITPKDKINKDIDDDCLSSEASSYCDTDTDIESIQEDPEEPRDLLGVKDRVKERKYNSVLQFHVDMSRIIESGKHLNKGQTRNILTTYSKHMKESFPWFDLKMANVFELVDKTRPFPIPYTDHCYAVSSVQSTNTNNAISLPSRDLPRNRKHGSSSQIASTNSDKRKCVLCSGEGDGMPDAVGRLLYLGQDEWMHINCGLWSSEVYEEVDGGLQNVYVAVSRGRLVRCSTCQERGATVGCCHKTCQATYHFLCARQTSCRFMEDKRIYCPTHKHTVKGEEKTEHFEVNRSVYVDMDSEKKKWKQVPGNRVNIIIGSLVISSSGKIISESDSPEALIPLDYVCTRKYWSTVDPNKRVTYTCRTKKVIPFVEENSLYAFHRTIDHSKGNDIVAKEMAAVKKWFKQLEEDKVEKKSRETNIIPPHLCPLYRKLKERENKEVSIVDKHPRCHTPPALVEADVRHCIDDIIDKVCRSVEEESLLFDTDLPGIVSADDNELISMVLNDLDACDPITLHSTPSTSGRPSPLDIDFLSTCDHMLDSGKVTHSGNITPQESQVTVCNTQEMMNVNEGSAVATATAALPPALHSALSQSSIVHNQTNGSIAHSSVGDHQVQQPSYQVQEQQGMLLPASSSLSQSAISQQSQLFLPETSQEPHMLIQRSQHSQLLSSHPTEFLMPPHSQLLLPQSVQSQTLMSSPSQQLELPLPHLQNPLLQNQHATNVLSDTVLLPNGSLVNETSPSEPYIVDRIDKSTVPLDATHPSGYSNGEIQRNCSSITASSDSNRSNSSSSLSTGITKELNIPDRSLAAANDNSNTDGSSFRSSVENLTSIDSNSGSDSSLSTKANILNSNSSVQVKGKVHKQICRVSPMPSTNGRRLSSTSEHSDTVSHDQPSPVSRRSTRAANEVCAIGVNKQGIDRKKICMKRNYKTVIKKYPLRSGMRKSKPYETVQIEINETIEIPRGEGSGMMRKSLKRKWSGILDSDEEEQKVNRERCDLQSKNVYSNESDTEENTKESSVSKKVLKFSDDNSDITVSIVNNNNNLCEFSKSRVHKYRHRTVLQLDGAADGSSSAEMSESQDEGDSTENYKSLETEDTCSPPLHSALAMRIKEQSLARSTPGEEGPYKCCKCKRLYRTKESYQKHIETCNFEVDSSSTSEDDQEEVKMTTEEEKNVSTKLHNTQSSFSNSLEQENIYNPVPGVFSSTNSNENSVIQKPVVQDFNTSQNISLIDNIVSNLESKGIGENLSQLNESYSSTFDHIRSIEEPHSKKMKLDSNLPRQPGVHRQVRTAIKKNTQFNSSNIEERESVQIAQGGLPPGTDVFVPPPVSPVKYNPTIKKCSSPRRYSNTRLRGNRNFQYRRIPHIPQEHYQAANSNLQVASPSTMTAPIQVTMQSIVSPPSAQILTPSATAAPFQQFPNQTNPYQAAHQLASPVTHISPAAAVQMTSPVPQQISPQINQPPQVLTMVSAPSVAVPQGYALQYVGSFRDNEMNSSGGLVSYPTTPVVVPPPQLVMTPQVVNTNITYSFTTPEALVINPPTVVSGMQSVQYLTPQQQQTQVIQPTEQVTPIVQYNPAEPPRQPSQALAHQSIHHGEQVQTSTCVPFSDLQNQQFCQITSQQQPASIVPEEFTVNNRELKPFDVAKQNFIPQNEPYTTPSVTLPTSSSSSSNLSSLIRRPQASVAPQVVQHQVVVGTSSIDSNSLESVTHSRLPFSDRLSAGIVRTVATVAPAVITSSSFSVSSCSSSTKLTTSESNIKVATVRPRPTYSYRDAMRERSIVERLSKPKSVELVPVENVSLQGNLKINEEEGITEMKTKTVVSDSNSDSEPDAASNGVHKDKEDKLETQSYKLVLRKDASTSTGFNVLPISGPDNPLPAPEVKELRIKAKVSVGPKRKKAKNRDPEKDLIFANKDINQDLWVNEQLPNFSVNPTHNPTQDDPSIFEKPKTCTTEPYIVFELTSEEGFHVESRHISEVWQKVFDAVSAARASMKIDSKGPSNIQQDTGSGGSMSGLHMLGLTHNAVQYLLEQLPGAKDCHKYSFQFHRRPQEEGAVEENPTGCARTESFKIRSPYDIFSWLASKHRRMPEKVVVQQEEIQLSTRRATSLELPMAMRYRHLRETAREAVGVFRSSIHGRGLFCKRDIDSGEMVIEYAGQVIRSSMCDMREKDYESKGIGCYMFRIDDDTVIDATMHGNAARFINHSCDPNCYSRVVDILGKKHIIIFALRRILRGEELTYDYKFPIEDDKIPCTCGARRCRKYLN